MLAFLLTFALFLLWSLIGHGVFALSWGRRKPLLRAFLAPAVGVVTLVLCTYGLNRLEIPVRTFGPCLAVVLTCAAGLAMWRFRARMQMPSYLAILGITFAALLLAGRPMFDFGFSWLSYGNDDMTNYVLAAQHFLHHGYMQPPSEQALLQNSDVSLFYWFMYSVHGARPGSDLLLAWAMSITGLSGHEVFMPVILALHLALISATGGLVYAGSANRSAALVAALLVAVSPLSTMGVIYQLIGQVFGLCAAVTWLTLWTQRIPPAPLLALSRRAIPVILLSAGQVLIYPELLVFLALAVLLYWGREIARKKVSIRTVCVYFGLTGVVTLALLNTYVPLAIFNVQKQAQGTLSAEQKTIYNPFFLVPTGLPILSGLLPLGAEVPKEPWQSLCIVSGALLLMSVAAAAVWGAWQGKPAAIMTLVMLAFAWYLFRDQADFGLFKLAMYIQPFILGTAVIACMRTLSPKQ